MRHQAITHGAVCARNRQAVIKSIGYGCDEAANIAVYYTKFIPAVRKTDPVPCYVIFPVTFALQIVQQQEENLRKGQLNKDIKPGTD